MKCVGQCLTHSRFPARGPDCSFPCLFSIRVIIGKVLMGYPHSNLVRNAQGFNFIFEGKIGEQGT